MAPFVAGDAALRGMGLAQFVAGSLRYSTPYTDIWALFDPLPKKDKVKSEYSLRPILNQKELSETKKNVTNF